MKPLVAIVGRPNVGKSTLFNRLVEEPRAIVEDLPGTTRDRLYADAQWGGVAFTLIDTGGLVLWTEDELTMQVRRQVELAMAEAEAILFLVDVAEGLTVGDEEIAELLRVSQKPLFLVVNKADNEARRLAATEFYSLGLGEPYPISALHGTGTGDLLDALVASFPPREEVEEAEGVRVAIVGRPNVGKSSLLNALLGWERAIVSESPGTTRDAIDTQMSWDSQLVTLIDTAGIRRRGRVQRGVEQYSVLRALRAIQRAHVVVLLLDAPQGVTAQDAHIAGYVMEEARGIVLVVNKWDLMQEADLSEYAKEVRQAFRFIPFAPLLFVSALTGRRVGTVLETALRVYQERLRRVPTSGLNRLLREAVASHSPPSKRGKRLRFYYATQAEVDPPTFVFFVNDPQLVHFSYRRYLENRLREAFGFEGTPLRLYFRRRSEARFA
ncbi:MAG TPA: ribosome biogenesis GTPase Der [Chloroflexi bacterium]|nr:ribosome biogenesis GTPase Der [Chloroflexota bacterium]